MRACWFSTSLVAIGIFVASTSKAADLAYPVTLPTPKIESLQTSLISTGGTVNVELGVQYDSTGKTTFTGNVDGSSVAGKPSLKTSTTGTAYKFSIRITTTPATVISISGVLGTGTAACTYAGPKGRINVPANPVTIGAVQPVPATLHLSPLISSKNVITGAARIDADYATNSTPVGAIKGKISTDLVSLAIKHGKRSATFSGKRNGSAYVGALRLTVPPAITTISNFSLPLTDVSVAAGPAVFQGSISVTANQLPAPAVGSTITIRTDANGDSQFLGSEVITGTADQQGRYRISGTVVRGRPVMVEIRRAGFAEILQSYPSVTPGAVLTRNAVLQPLVDLEVSGGSATASDGSIQLDGLPTEISSVQARVFSPATDADQFPGQFADNQGNLLVSSVFSTVEAVDASGHSVTNVGNNATLCMRVPIESWPSLQDLLPGNQQIDVPLYYYDERAGDWKRNPSNGWLENSSRTKIAEDQLAAIRNGLYLGDVLAVGPITHLSWWNIDWPISSHTCIKGVIVDTSGIAVSGASMSVFGLTYNGTSGPNTTGPDGSFCFEIMRSEQPGEDVDGDNTLGEEQKVQLKVKSGTNLYAFGPFSTPATAATCMNGTGLSLGQLVLNDASLQSVSSCTITGRVVYSGIEIGGTSPYPEGSGVRFAKVVGYDPEALTSEGVCSNCLVTTTDINGYFGLQIPVLAGPTLSAIGYVNSPAGYGAYIGQLTTNGCPPGEVTIEADYFHFGAVMLTLFQKGDPWGYATIFADKSIRVTSMPASDGLYYIGGAPSVGLPTQTGPWATVSMRNSTPGTFIGRIYFTVASVFPPSGTWELKDGSVSASGTWRSSVPLP